MILHIYIFRHGQTYYNRNKIFTGWKDSKLTPKGILDARKVGQKLRNKKFQVAFQTHLSRSKATLREVLKYQKNRKKIKIITDDRMIERSYGILEGKHHSYIINKYGEKRLQLIRRSYSYKVPKGESVKLVEKRVNPFIKDLIKMMKKEKVNVALSAHGNSMRPFRKYFEKLTVEQMMKIENPWDDYFHYTIKV